MDSQQFTHEEKSVAIKDPLYGEVFNKILSHILTNI